MRSRKRSGDKSRSMFPAHARLMAPVSSETMTESASVSSVMPMPARWRVPSCVESSGLIDSGRKQAAAAMRSFLHDHRAIMQRRARAEDGGQQIIGKLRVQRNPALNVGSQSDFALDHDQRPGLVLREQVRGQNNVIVNFADTGLHRAAEGKAAADARQHLANLSRKDDNQGKDSVRQQRADQPVQGAQLSLVRHIKRQHQGAHPDQHGRGPRTTYQQKKLVDKKSHQQDVERRPDREGRQAFGDVAERVHVVSEPRNCVLLIVMQYAQSSSSETALSSGSI